MNTEPQPLISISESNKKKNIAIIVVAVLVLVMSGIFYRLSVKTPVNIGASRLPVLPSLYPTPTPTIEESQPQKITFYSLSNNKMLAQSSITVRPNDAFGLRPVLDSSGNIYLIDNDSVIKYSLASKTKTIIYTNQLSDRQLIAVAIKEPDYFYLTEAPIPYYGKTEMLHTIREIKISDGETRVIENLRPTLYGNSDYLFKSSEGDIIGTFGGDGCGGFGKIYRYTDHAIDVVKTGGGCVEEPTYLGAAENRESLFLLSSVPKTFPETKIDSFYTQHVLTGNKEIIYDFKNISNQPEKVILNQEKTKVAAINKTSITIIDLVTREIEKTIPLDNIDSYFWLMIGDMLYSYDYNKNIYIVDIPSGTVTRIWYQDVFSVPGRVPNYFGQWNGEPFFYVSE